MQLFWKLVLMLGIVFVLTYDTKSGVIERYIEKPSAQQKFDCPQANFQAIQFAEPQPCENKGFKQNAGAIIA